MPRIRIVPHESPSQGKTQPDTWADAQAAELHATANRFAAAPNPNDVPDPLDEPSIQQFESVDGRWMLLQTWSTGRRIRYSVRPGGRSATVEISENGASWGLVASVHVPPKAEPIFSVIPEAKLSEVDQMVMQHFATCHWEDAQLRGEPHGV